jgi:hypothetical protein
MTCLHLLDLDRDVVEFHNPACRDEDAEVKVTVRRSPIVDFRYAVFLTVVGDEVVDCGIDRRSLGLVGVCDVCDSNLYVRADLAWID